MKKLALLLALLLSGAAQAQQVDMPPPAGTVAFLCAYNASPPALATGHVGYAQCDINGKIITSGGGGGSLSATATAAAPTYVEGSSDPLSMDLAGNTRVLDKNSAALLAAVQASIPAGTAIIGKVGIDQTTLGTTNSVYSNQVSQYPVGAVPITISATGTTGATTATLAASASIKTYICWFSIRANATAAATANSTVTGTVTGTLNFTQWTAPLASGIGLTEQIFSPCIPSSAINTGIAVISAAPGTGGVVSVSAGGYQAP